MKHIFSLITAFSVVYLLAFIKYVFELSTPIGLVFFFGWIGGMGFNFCYNYFYKIKDEKLPL